MEFNYWLVLIYFAYPWNHRKSQTYISVSQEKDTLKATRLPL